MNTTSKQRLSPALWLFASYISLGSLIGLFGVNTFFVEPAASQATQFAIFAAYTLPIVVCLPGLIRLGLVSTFCLCMLTMVFFTQGVVLAYEEPASLFAWAEIVLSLALCTTTAFLLRHIREERERNAAESAR